MTAASSEEMPQEIFFEFTRIGNVVKVSAIDAKSGTEVSFVAPASTPLDALKLMGRQKLAYVLRKNAIK
ncbi:MAG: hypothetical protein IKD08_01175 [Alphaproteobacteria bacterium]|nr:hypothetical protein [Alphaproteobacteria bacterium]